MMQERKRKPAIFVPHLLFVIPHQRFVIHEIISQAGPAHFDNVD